MAVDLLIDMPVRDAADVLGVSERRVQMLVEAGAIHAVRQGRDLRLSRRDVERLSANGLVGGRPYNAANAWRRLVDGDLPDVPVSVLLARLARRGQRVLLVAHPSLLGRLAEDDRLLLSGHTAAERAPSGEEVLEAYLSRNDVKDVIDEYGLRPPDRATNVILRVVPPEVELPDEVPSVLVALDLLESPLPRVRGVGEQMLGGLL